jgi:hypothetical protein
MPNPSPRRIHDLPVQKDSKIRIILIHITDARRRDWIGFMDRDFAVPSRG